MDFHKKSNTNTYTLNWIDPEYKSASFEINEDQKQLIDRLKQLQLIFLLDSFGITIEIIKN